MKILVTGASGYIGSSVVQELLASGHAVIAADLQFPTQDPRVTYLPVSVLEPDEHAFEHLGSPDVCIHLAWRNGFIHNAPSHMAELSAHFSFLSNMIRGGLKRLSVMGTMHEIGYWEGAIDENTPCNPLSQYGIAKNALRQALLRLEKPADFSLCWLRAFYILGNDARNHSVFSKILQMEKEGKEFFPFTSGKNLYDFIHVDELAKMIVRASLQTEETGIINVCTGKPISLAQQVTEFIAAHDLKIRPQYGAFPDREYDSPGIWGNPDRIRKIMRTPLT